MTTSVNTNKGILSFKGDPLTIISKKVCVNPVLIGWDEELGHNLRKSNQTTLRVNSCTYFSFLNQLHKSTTDNIN